jgi:hypothetical protein
MNLTPDPLSASQRGGIEHTGSEVSPYGAFPATDQVPVPASASL